MEFKISRTSMWSDEKPCDKAYKKQIIRIDERGFNDFDEFKEKLHENWEDDGFNHKIIPANGTIGHQHIYREFNDEIWCIKINTLEELLELYKTNGDLIIKTAWENDDIYEIEIYDDYRE